MRACAALIIIFALLAWRPDPAGAQSEVPICPTINQVDLSPNQSYQIPFRAGFDILAGQFSSGIQYGSGSELLIWPAYTAFTTVGTTLTNVNQGAIRTFVWCYNPEPTPTRTRTPTRTPTNPPNTATSTNTAGPTTTPTITPSPDWPPVCPGGERVWQGPATTGEYIISGSWEIARYRPSWANYVSYQLYRGVAAGNIAEVNMSRTVAYWIHSFNVAGEMAAFYRQFYYPYNETYLIFNWDINDSFPVDGYIDFCPDLPTVTPTGPTAAPPNTATAINTSTSTATATGTTTTTPTRTATASPGCSGVTYSVPPAPLSVEIPLTNGGQIIVYDGPIYVNLPNRALELAEGPQTWTGSSGNYVAYNLGEVATSVYICLAISPTPLPSVTLTATFVATSVVVPPDIGATPVCFPLPTATSPIAYSLPDLSLELPTLRPLGSPTATGTITATPALSTTALVQFVATVQAGISTPAASMATVSAGYNWQSGAELSATTVAAAAPALAWMAILNPSSPAWQTEGGPLWALAPLILPVLPIIGFFFLVLLVRFVLFLADIILKIVDLIIKLIELIPGE